MEFLACFLHKFGKWLVKLSLLSIITPNSFFGCAAFYDATFNLIEISSVDVSKRFDLSGFASKTLGTLFSISFKTVSTLVPSEK